VHGLELLRSFIKELFNVPNTLSLFRIACAPLLAVLWLYFEWYEAALVVGTISGITDQLDGAIARKLGQTTQLGALLDQLGDLVFESTCLILAVVIGEMWMGLIIIYLFREFTVAVVQTYMYSNGGTLPSSVLGKAKSSYLQWAFFFFFLGLILIDRNSVPASWYLVGVSPGRIMVWLANLSILTGIAMGVYSGFVYLKAFARFYTDHSSRAPE